MFNRGSAWNAMLKKSFKIQIDFAPPLVQQNWTCRVWFIKNKIQFPQTVAVRNNVRKNYVLVNRVGRIMMITSMKFLST